MHSTETWQDIGAPYREDPAHQRRFGEIRAALEAVIGTSVLEGRKHVLRYEAGKTRAL